MRRVSGPMERERHEACVKKVLHLFLEKQRLVSTAGLNFGLKLYLSTSLSLTLPVFKYDIHDLAYIIYLYTTFKFLSLKINIVIQYEIHLFIDRLWDQKKFDGYFN